MKGTREGPKRQYLTTLQRSLNNTARHLSIHTPIIKTPGLLKLTLVLGFQLDHCKNLDKGLHQFRLGQHTSADRKVFKVSADQHQIIAGGGTTPYLADAAMMTALDGASLSATLTMARGVGTRG